MAYRSKVLSISTILYEDAVSSSVEMLYVNVRARGENYAVPRHAHDFWQLEAILGGSCMLSVEDGAAATLCKDDLILIPPGVSHELDYPDSGCEWVSFKFRFSGTGTGLMTAKATGELALTLKLLLKLSTGETGSAEKQRALAGALACVVELMLAACGRDALREPLRRSVMQAVLKRRGQEVEVGALARELGYSPNYLSHLFRQETGERLKTFLDRLRAEFAARMLRYDNVNITETALALGFADVYSFSRFFTRVTGTRPSLFRKSGLRHKTT